MSGQTQSTAGTPDGDKSQSANDLIPLYKEGDDGPSLFSAKDANRIVKVCRAIQRLKVVVTEADADSDGNFINDAKFTLADQNALLELVLAPGSGGSGGGTSNVVAMQVSSWTVGNDYLMAKIYSFDLGVTGSDFKVALPWLLRVAQSPGGSTPQIWPPFAANDIIIALSNPGFGTGVGDSDYLALQDRNWAQYISYTDGGCNPKHRIMVGGPEVDGA